MKNLHRFIKKKELVDSTIQLVQTPTENPPGNEKIAAQFLKPLLSRMGFKIKTVLSPKGRWNLIAEKRWGKGGRTLIFGPGGTNQIHTTDESVEVEALVHAADIYGLILINYLSKKDEARS